MLGNCPNLVWDSLYVRFAAVFNQERCSLSGSTVYPGARFGVSLKLLYPETDLLAESFCCRSCWLHASCGVEVLMNSFLAATIDSLVRTPAGRFHMWAGESRSLERFWLLRYRGLGANVHVALGGSGLDYVILLSEGGGVGSWLRLITEGGKKCQKLIT